MLIWQFVKWLEGNRRILLRKEQGYVQKGLKIQKGKREPKRRRLQAKRYIIWKQTPFISGKKPLTSEERYFRGSSVYHHWGQERGQERTYFNRRRKLRLRGETGWWWMPQEASRYPPIHDQIDTPTDFGMAVWKKCNRGEMEAGHREKPSKGRARQVAESMETHNNTVLKFNMSRHGLKHRLRNIHHPTHTKTDTWWEQSYDECLVMWLSGVVT